MYFNPTSVVTRWMIAALLLSPIYSVAGFSKLAPEARDLEQGGCISGTPFCFPQAFDHVTGISIALIIPSKSGNAVGGSSFLPPDFIASISTPLPYGFAGMGGTGEAAAANDATSSEETADWWIEGIFGRSQFEGSYAPVVQIYAPSTTDDVLTRVENPLDAGAKITISPRSTESSTTSHMLFRCQNCPIQTLSGSSASPPITIAILISPAQPIGSDLAGNSSAATGATSSGSAVLPLAEVKRGSVVVTPFRAADYEAIAKILQLD